MDAGKANGHPIREGGRSDIPIRPASIAGAGDAGAQVAPIVRAWRAILGHRPGRVRALAAGDRRRMAEGAEQRISLRQHYRTRAPR